MSQIKHFKMPAPGTPVDAETKAAIEQHIQSCIRKHVPEGATAFDAATGVRITMDIFGCSVLEATLMLFEAMEKGTLPYHMMESNVPGVVGHA